MAQPTLVKVPYKPLNELKEEIYKDYVAELKRVRYNKVNPVPLYLYSKRVYRAYRNAWRLIDRRLLTQEEIDIMMRLGIYKPSLGQLGVRNLKGDVVKEMCKIRIGYETFQQGSFGTPKCTNS
jgi:hypothetical protein